MLYYVQVKQLLERVMFGLIFSTALTIVAIYIVFAFFAFFLILGLLVIGTMGYVEFHEPLYLIPLGIGVFLVAALS